MSSHAGVVLLSHAGVVLPSHAGDGAVEPTWPWRDVNTELC
jgi:hypothetical protein